MISATKPKGANTKRPQIMEGVEGGLGGQMGVYTTDGVKKTEDKDVL